MNPHQRRVLSVDRSTSQSIGRFISGETAHSK